MTSSLNEEMVMYDLIVDVCMLVFFMGWTIMAPVVLVTCFKIMSFISVMEKAGEEECDCGECGEQS